MQDKQITQCPIRFFFLFLILLLLRWREGWNNGTRNFELGPMGCLVLVAYWQCLRIGCHRLMISRLRIVPRISQGKWRELPQVWIATVDCRWNWFDWFEWFVDWLKNWNCRSSLGNHFKFSNEHRLCFTEFKEQLESEKLNRTNKLNRLILDQSRK